jgi:hypothetical protein
LGASCFRKRLESTFVILNSIQDLLAGSGLSSCSKIAGQARNDCILFVILNSIQDLIAGGGLSSCSKIAGQARNDLFSKYDTLLK